MHLSLEVSETLEQQAIKIKTIEFYKLLQNLYTRQSIALKIKRVGDSEFTDYSQVLRVSQCLVMLRSLTSGDVTMIFDLKDVAEFRLDKNYLQYRADLPYLLA